MKSMLIAAWAALTAATAASAQTADASSIAARAWVDIDEVTHQSPLRLWIEITNASTNPIDDLGLEVLAAPGFQPAPNDRCVKSQQPICFEDRDANPAKFSIAAGETVLASSSFIRVREGKGHLSSGKVYLSGSLRWTEAAATSQPAATAKQPAATAKQPSVSHRRVITAGPVTLPSDSWLASSSMGALKDLAMPLTLAVLAIAAQRLLQKRTETQAVWTELLSTSLTHSKECYLPLTSAAHQLSAEVKADNRTGRPELLFAFLLFNRRMRALAKNLGGFHFKSKSGEKAAVASWLLMRHWQLGIFSRADLEQCVGLIEVHTTFGEFKQKLNQDPAFAAAIGNIQAQWLAPGANTSGSSFELLALKGLMTVVAIESDRPFEQWYLPARSYLDRERLKDLIRIGLEAKQGLPQFSMTAGDEARGYGEEFVKRLQNYRGELPWRRVLGWMSTFRTDTIIVSER